MRPARVDRVLAQVTLDVAAFVAGLDPDHDSSGDGEGVDDVTHGSLPPGFPPAGCDLVSLVACALAVNGAFAGLVSAF